MSDRHQYRAKGRRYRSKLPMLSGRPDLTPLIDVLFLSLIFFMLSSSFVKMYGIKVEIPKVGPTRYSSVEKYIISVVRSNERDLIYFKDEELSLNDLAERLADLAADSPNSTVVICADGGVPFELVANIMAMAERARLASFIAVNGESLRKEAVFEK
ncbi:MAG: biopolymer transporter ExbD [Lentisphaeria bacterium]|nr:biopolymer transporter ExbD [Lentisphaeria bacterium]